MRLIAGAALCIGLAGCSTLPSDSVSTDTGPAPRCDRSVPWTYAAAGREIFCGVHADGCAECWGDEPEADTGWDSGPGLHDFGQYDIPNVGFESVVSIVSPYPQARNRGLCGLTIDREAVCWGRSPAEFSGHYSEVRVGEDFQCGLRSEGGVECPQYRSFGDLFPADATTFDFSGYIAGALRPDGELWLGLYETRFERVDAPAVPYVAMDVTENDPSFGPWFVVCAIRETEQSLDCWNASDDGSTGEVIDTVPPGTFTTVCLTADDHACALDEAGYPTCWGDGPMGEPVEPLSQLSCGYSDACGVTFDGRLLCWGACDHGECDVPG